MGKMRELHQDHNRNLQHQIEMMAQIDEMKKIYELEKLNEDEARSDDKALKNLESITRDHDRALLKQKQMINDIELIKMRILDEQQNDEKVIYQLEKMRADNEKQLEDQRHHDQKLDDLKEAIDSLNQECDIDFEENMRVITQEHNRSLNHQSELMRQIEEMKAMYVLDKKEREKAAKNERFKEKIITLEKTHEDNLQTQKNLIAEIKSIQKNVSLQNNSDLSKKVELLQQQSFEECEHQEGVTENIKELNNLLEQSAATDDIAFEEKMRELHQDHNQNLQHQIELMAQIDEMKKIHELDILNEEATKSDERIKNLDSIKRDHDKALLKQKQMTNDIELIQMNILSEQQKDDKIIHQLEEMRAENEKQLEEQRHHDQKLDDLKEATDSLNQVSDIDFEEDMRLITKEHNRSLDHQSELMRQIEDMKALYF